ncbi:MAG: hypothetical protein U0R17_04665 [Acidimicrobiia bacterium]
MDTKLLNGHLDLLQLEAYLVDQEKLEVVREYFSFTNFDVQEIEINGTSRAGKRNLYNSFDDFVRQLSASFVFFSEPHGWEKSFELLRAAASEYPARFHASINDLIDVVEDIYKAIDDTQGEVEPNRESSQLSFDELPDVFQSFIQLLKDDDIKAKVQLLEILESTDINSGRYPGCETLINAVIYFSMLDPEFDIYKKLFQNGSDAKNILFKKILEKELEDENSFASRSVSFLSTITGVDKSQVAEKLLQTPMDLWPSELLFGYKERIASFYQRAEKNYGKMRTRIDIYSKTINSEAVAAAKASEMLHELMEAFVRNFDRFISQGLPRGFTLNRNPAQNALLISLKNAIAWKNSELRKRKNLPKAEGEQREQLVEKKTDEVVKRKVIPAVTAAENIIALDRNLSDHRFPNYPTGLAIDPVVHALENLDMVHNATGIKKIATQRQYSDPSGKSLAIFELKPSEHKGFSSLSDGRRKGSRGYKDYRVLFTLFDNGNVGLLGVVHRSELQKTLNAYR